MIVRTIFFHFDGLIFNPLKPNNYEKDKATTKFDGLFAIYEITENEHGIHKTMHYVLKDHLGSYETIITPGKEVEKLSFDPWGRRRNPVDWTYDNVPTNYTFSRGYTGHEHLDYFDLINMPARRSASGGGNGRVYDPWLGRFLSPGGHRNG